MFAVYKWNFSTGPENDPGAVPDVAVVARELGYSVGSRFHIDDDSIDLLDFGGLVQCERHPQAFHCYTFRNPYIVLHLDQVLQTLGGRRGGRFGEVPIPADLNKPWNQLSWFNKIRVLGPSVFWPESWHRIC